MTTDAIWRRGERPWAAIGALVVLLLALVVAAIVFAPPARSQGDGAARYVGVASCAGSTCHGRMEGDGTVVRQDELMKWQEPSSAGGAHSRAWAVLGNSRSQFSPLSGIEDEIKIASVRSAARGGYAGSGFAPGTVFGTGTDTGGVFRIAPDGSTTTLVNLSAQAGRNVGAGTGIYVDRTGVWGGDVLVSTTRGELWRINSQGEGTFVADIIMQPAETALLRLAARMGFETHPGRPMLEHQVPHYLRFFGQPEAAGLAASRLAHG